MITFTDAPVYLACGSTDLRKQINGLALLVESVFKLDPFTPALFVFCNRGRNRLKILTFDSDGFVLYLKRLEKGRFSWPQGVKDAETMQLSADELSSLLYATKLERKLKRDELSKCPMC